jgi:phosphate-selective porin OprO/OprP
VKSGDGRFTMSFRVRLQIDSANFMQDSPTQLMASAPAAIRDLSSGALVRRAYFGVEGKAFSDPVAVSEDAPLMDQLLAYTGRRP